MSYVLRLGEGVPIAGTAFIEKVRSAESGGLLSCQEATMAPRHLVVPHVHTREDEFSLVISGRIGARVGDQEYEVGPGGLLLKPRGVPHTMWNPTDEPAVSFEFISPAGFEGFFREIGELSLAGEVTPPMAAEVGARYGMAPKPEWIPELIARYGVRP